jgi:N-acetylglucosaminyl-diphospho-decaprenol L-rhamnosyltransferase
VERFGIATGPAVAVVIVSFNVRDLLASCLTSLGGGGDPDLEIVVVDNASSDGSADTVRAAFPAVRVIQNAENRGFAAASNQGTAATGAPYVLSLNPDTVVSPSAVARLRDYLDAHQDVGAVGPKIVRPDGSLDLAARRSFPTPGVAFFRITRLSRVFPHSPTAARYNLTFRGVDEVQEIDAGTGACLLFRRAALDQVGLFDEAFFMYGEDLDLCYRLKRAGWKVMYVPQAQIVHVKGASSRQRSQRMIREFHRAMTLFFRKHYRATTPAPVAALVYGGIQLRSTALQAVNRLRKEKRVSR